MTEKMKWLEKYAPLGIGVKNQVIGILAGVAVATLHSMWFFVAYQQARQELYMTVGSKQKLIEGAIIQDFSIITQHLFWTFYIVEIVIFLSVISFYMYHYDGSKMMYLMKRLPDKWDVHRRCWTLPIAGTVLTVVWMLILRMIYYAVYILCTPSQCLPL